MIALHATWLVTLWLFGWNRSLVVPFVALYVLLQIARVWVMRTLGPRWTTRIIVVPGAARVTAGPFATSTIRTTRSSRWSCRAPRWRSDRLHAFVFGVLNLAMLSWCIRVEGEGLRREWGPRSD